MECVFHLYLQDALPTFSTKVAFECIEKELGMPLESAYSRITAEPIAAASLGQVYKAVLRSTGETVAVKVQRPGIEEQVGLDFYLVRGLTALIDRYVDIITSNVTDLLDEFARRVYQELNYVQVQPCNMGLCDFGFSSAFGEVCIQMLMTHPNIMEYTGRCFVRTGGY